MITIQAENKIKSDYISMYDIYATLTEYILPCIENGIYLSTDEISRVFMGAIMINEVIEKDALYVHNKLPKKIKSALRDRKNKIFEKLTAEGWHSIRDYKKRRIVYLQYASLLKINILKNKKVTTKGDTIKLSKRKDYSVFTKAYKELNDALFLHITGSQYLNEYEIECLLTTITYVLDELYKKTFDACACGKILRTIEKHKFLEKYFNDVTLTDENYSFVNPIHRILREHIEWKAVRVKYLQEIFPSKCDDEPHDEEWFVKHKKMYNDKY